MKAGPDWRPTDTAFGPGPCLTVDDRLYATLADEGHANDLARTFRGKFPGKRFGVAVLSVRVRPRDAARASTAHLEWVGLAPVKGDVYQATGRKARTLFALGEARDRAIWIPGPLRL